MRRQSKSAMQEAHAIWTGRLGMCCRCAKWKGFPVCQDCLDDETFQRIKAKREAGEPAGELG